MKKILLPIAVLLAMAVVSTSCKDDDDDPPKGKLTLRQGLSIEAGFDGGSLPALTRVRATEFVTEVMFGETNFDNGFDLTLNTTNVEDAAFAPLTVYFHGMDLSNVTISDATVQVTDCDIEGWTGTSAWIYGTNYVGDFSYSKETDNSFGNAIFIYSPKAVTMTGTTNAEGIEWAVNVSLATGWNVLYVSAEAVGNAVQGKITTSAQAGYKWYFDDGSAEYAKPAQKGRLKAKKTTVLEKVSKKVSKK